MISFLEISTDEFTDDTYEIVLELDEDILQIVSQDQLLGWYPSFNPNGQYKVKLVELVVEEKQPEKWDSSLVTI
ncbi:hypothetical protein [Paenibacillus sp. Soil787]|uniref:hypothetical protein n=1 Tax=Paenibacillus sp. Soil787 TaxID=1736411 RepID=UPI0006FBFCDC|nr:hypothetical protein [Paenibacillus sp. Soil787]KRF31653.1 hypothetical protein ASG93_04740 [Paenibacillus sp. Soil787]